MMIHVRIITPKGIYKEFDTPILNIPTVDGERGLLPNHMPLVTMLQITMRYLMVYSTLEIM